MRKAHTVSTGSREPAELLCIEGGIVRDEAQDLLVGQRGGANRVVHAEGKPVARYLAEVVEAREQQHLTRSG